MTLDGAVLHDSLRPVIVVYRDSFSISVPKWYSTFQYGILCACFQCGDAELRRRDP